MSAAVISTGTQVNAATTALAVPYPAGIAAGNMLYLCVSSGSTAGSVTTPPGWQIVIDSGGTSNDLFVAYKVADGTESGTLTVTTSAADTWHGVMVAMSGVATTGVPYANSQVNTGGSGTSLGNFTGQYYDTNASASSRLLGLMFAQNSVPSTYSAEAMSLLTGVTITELQDANAQLVAYMTATGGTQGVFSATLSAAGYWNVVTIDIVEDIAPSAPTISTPGTMDPTLASGIFQFSWASHDTDDGDGASFGYDIGFSSDGGSTWPITFSSTSTDQFYDAPASTLAVGTWKYRVRTYDRAGLVGPYATSASFTVALPTPPATPTMLCTPNNSDGSITSVVTWSANNLLDAATASLEPVTGSAPTGQWSTITNVAPSQSTTVALDGTHSLRLASVAAGTMSAGTLVTPRAVPVVPLAQYTAAYRIRAGASPRSCTATIQWMDASLANISTSAGTAVADTTSGFTVISVTANAPSNAAFAYLIVTVAATGGASEYHYVDEADIHLGASTAFLAGGVPPTTSIDIYRRLWNDGTDGIRIAVVSPGVLSATYIDYRVASRVEYQYRAVARTAVDTVTAASVWSPV